MKFHRHILFSLVVASCMPVSNAQVTLNPSATRALGAARLEQLGFITNSQPNLVEGRELNSPNGIAIDKNSSPVHLYVADTLNNRVLGWKDANNLTNGQFADLVIGQADLFTTTQQGPGRGGSTRPSSGLTAPMGMVVDASGNLYVIDAGNNRILRFPQPYAQTGDQFPDLVLGQQSFSSNAPNAGGIGASTLNFTLGGGIGQAYLKFDSSNNLWVADVGNQRVLRYPAASLTAGNNGPAADVVLGQPDFTTSSLPRYDPTSLTVLNYPTGIAFDTSGGRLYISESIPGTSTAGTTSAVRSRILVFQPPYSSNMAAQRIIGTVQTPTGQSPPPTVSESQLGPQASATFLAAPNNIAVADTTNNRIMVYAPFEQFTSDTLTQKAQLAVGQSDLLSGKANRGNANANSNTLQLPADGAFQPATSTHPAVLFVADTGNNRVLAIPITPNSSTLGYNSATVVLGQVTFAEEAPNYIEGREFQFATPAGGADGGIAMDNANGTGVPHMYVADTYNNRILCFVDYRTVQTGGTADFVIGQPDFFHSIPNYNPTTPDSSTANAPTQVGLFHPTGMVVDPKTGDLYVADSGNSRVLRFPAPFAQPTKLLQSADLVLGQSNFTTKITDVSGSRMAGPYGLAWASGVGLLVSDTVDNRVLLFPGSNFASGMSATSIWGQPNPTAITPGTTDNRFNGPHGIALDSSFRLYVIDTGNSRMVVFDDIRKVGTDPHSLVSVPGLTTPRSVFIDQYTPTGGGTPTDEIWIGQSQQAIRFAGGYTDLFSSNFTPDLVIPEGGGALALTLDQFGALYVCDLANRVVIHYIGLQALNGASYNKRVGFVAPNTIVSLFSQGGQFGAGQQSFTNLPLPTMMQAIEVLLNGNPVPLYYVSPSQINALIPNNAPTSGTADLQVVRTDNGQTLGDATINMNTVAPGIFTMNGSGTGQAAAVNPDGTYNGPSNPISRGQVLQVYGTGIGNIAGAPNDGSAVSGATPTTQTTTATINGINCPVQYSGMAPQLVGVWQINVQIADGVVPTSSLQNRTSELIIFLGSTPSSGSALYGIQVTVWVKQ